MFGRRHSSVIQIDRSVPFDPVSFFNNKVFSYKPPPENASKEEKERIPPGEGFSIWRGPANGDGLIGEEEQDARSLALDKIDFSRIVLNACKKDERVTREERARRLRKDGLILPDAKIVEVIFENKENLPDEWKEKVDGSTQFIFFEGTTIRGQAGTRNVLFIYFGRLWNEGIWHCNCGSISDSCFVSSPSAVIAA
jgi:hypothetical protein